MVSDGEPILLAVGVVLQFLARARSRGDEWDTNWQGWR